MRNSLHIRVYIGLISLTLMYLKCVPGTGKIQVLKSGIFNDSDQIIYILNEVTPE